MARTPRSVSECGLGRWTLALITVAVGTFIHGFDELLQAADDALGIIGTPGFAQTGHSRYRPRYLSSESFLDHDELMSRLTASRLLICHAGMGLIGDGLRAGCRIIVYPRQGSTTRDNPANDQTLFAKALSKRMGFGLCLAPDKMVDAVQHELSREAPPRAPIVSNVPLLIRDHLVSTQRT